MISKCDEHKPTCQKCSGSGTPCSYLQTYRLKKDLPNALTKPSSQTQTLNPDSFSSSQLQSNLLPSFTMLDLKILHFWTTSSELNFNDNQSGAELFRITFVEIALECPFLMHEILSLSGLHLAYTSPNQADIYRDAAVDHHAKALSLFQPQIANLTSENCHACFAFSTILSILTWAFQSSDDNSNPFFKFKSPAEPEYAQIHWMKVHRGSHAVIDAAWPWIETGPLSPLLRPWKGLRASDPTPLTLFEKTHLDALAETWNTRSAHQSSVPFAQKEILETTLQTLRRVFSISNTSAEISRPAATIAWMTLIPVEFVQMTEEMVPEALLILAHYCVLLKRMEYLWWVKGKAYNLLQTIRNTLGDRWERWLQWPIDEVTRHVLEQGTSALG
jgi:hypothetical protein